MGGAQECRWKEREKQSSTWFLSNLCPSGRDESDIPQMQHSREDHEHVGHLLWGQPHHVKCMTHLSTEIIHTYV